MRLVPSFSYTVRFGVPLERGQRVLRDVLRPVELALLDHEPLGLGLVDVAQVDRGELVGGPAAPVVRVLLADVDDVGLPLLEHVGPGAGRVVAQPPLGLVATLVLVLERLGADDEEEPEPGQEGVVRLLQVEDDRARRRRLHPRDRLDVEERRLLQRLGPLHGELDGGGVERGPVAELDALTQLERVGLAVRRRGPRGGQHRARPAQVVAEVEQRLVEVVARPPQRVERARVRVVGAELRCTCRRSGRSPAAGDGLGRTAEMTATSERRDQPESAMTAPPGSRVARSGGHQGTTAISESGE